MSTSARVSRLRLVEHDRDQQILVRCGSWLHAHERREGAPDLRHRPEDAVPGCRGALPENPADLVDRLLFEVAQREGRALERREVRRAPPPRGRASRARPPAAPGLARALATRITAGSASNGAPATAGRRLMRSMAQLAAIRCSQVARAARPSKLSQLGVRLQKRLLHHVLRVLLRSGSAGTPPGTHQRCAAPRSCGRPHGVLTFARVRMAASASFTVSRLDGRRQPALASGG